MERLHLGVLGCAALYANRVSVSVKNSQFVEPYAIASRDEAKAKVFAETHGFSRYYGSYEALLADSDVDFVYIPLPNHLHVEYIKKSAEAGKSVICEKPFCLNAREAAEAAEVCKKNNVHLMEAFMYRFHPQWIRAREIVSAGGLGELLTVNGHFSYFNKDENNIRNIAEYGGGGIYDLGCYMVSTARLLFGREPRRVVCALLRDPVFKTDSIASALLDFGDGKTSTFTVGTQMCDHQRVMAIGSGGSLELKIPIGISADSAAPVDLIQGSGRRGIDIEPADHYIPQFDGFAQSVMRNTPVPIPVTDAIANMAVLDALFKSAESGAWEDVKRYPQI